MLGVEGLGGIVGFVVIFAENGFGYDIFFCSPVAQVAVAAALAAKGEVEIDLGIGGGFADGASMLHGICFCESVESRRLQPKTRSGAPVAMRASA